MELVVLSHYQAIQILNARHKGLASVEVSLNLGVSISRLPISSEGLLLPGEMCLKWEQIGKIAEANSSCFAIEGESIRAIQFYSEQTGRVFSLYPTQGAPTMLISGIPMHRIKDTEPHADTLQKVGAIKPLVGQVLDTATGLGYTAIEAARTAEHVTTIELDSTVLAVCHLNPWSQTLFDNPKITQLIGDSFDVIGKMKPGSFTRVLHDPPAFSLAGDLYSGDFYRELYRVMRNRSHLFHYIGDPDSKSGRSITAGVIRRLEQVGFQRVQRAPRAFGVVAVK